MTRGFPSSLLRSLRVMACSSRRIVSRQDEAEFPAASSGSGRTCSLPTFRGVRAQDCASTDALRPNKNRVIIGYQHELTFIRQTSAPCARRQPSKGRSSPASARGGSKARKENILAASGCFFWKQSTAKEIWKRFAQRISRAAAATATTTAAVGA